MNLWISPSLRAILLLDEQDRTNPRHDKVERTRAEPTEGVKTPLVKEEVEEGESLGSHMVECAKLTHEWVEVNLLPRFV